MIPPLPDSNTTSATITSTPFSPEELYLRNIVIPLVQFQDAVQIERKTDDRGILLTLKVQKEDMGRIIGKGGETARAMRRIMRQYGNTRDQRISIKVYEPSI